MKKNLLIILLIIGVGLVSRLFYIGTNVFFFDGDEAIVGLMALDILDGNLPLYFYGQNYGLAFFEAILISLGVLVFKTSMLAIKIPMLILWLSSVTLMALTFFKILDKKLLFVILFISVLLFSPTWLVWSLKARGGYLSSFFFTSLIIFLSINYQKYNSLYFWPIIGLLSVFIFETQPLWLPGIIPVILFFLFEKNKKRKEFVKSAGLLIIGASITYAFLFYLKMDLFVAWQTPSPKIMNSLASISNLPQVLIKTLGGNYFLSTSYEPSNSDYSFMFLFWFLITSVYIIFRLIKDKKLTISTVFLISALFSLSGFLVKAEPRYLLPFFGFALFMLVSVFAELKLKGLRYATLTLCCFTIMTGIYHLPNFKNYSFNNMSMTKVDSRISDDTKLMEILVRTLEENNIKYVFATNEFLQYQLNYLTDNKILTIGRKDRCRTPENIPIVMKAYEEHSEQFAIIGYNFHYQYSGKLPTIGKKIFYLLRPDRKSLNSVGFFANEKDNETGK